MLSDRPKCPRCGSRLFVRKRKVDRLYLNVHVSERPDVHRCYRCFEVFGPSDLDYIRESVGRSAVYNLVTLAHRCESTVRLSDGSGGVS